MNNIDEKDLIPATDKEISEAIDRVLLKWKMKSRKCSVTKPLKESTEII